VGQTCREVNRFQAGSNRQSAGAARTNQIVLVVLLVLVIEPRHSIEVTNEDEGEKFARSARAMRVTKTLKTAHCSYRDEAAPP